MKRLIYFIIGGALYIMVNLYCLSGLNVLASDLKENAAELEEQYSDLTEDIEEEKEDENELQDTIDYIQTESEDTDTNENDSYRDNVSEDSTENEEVMTENPFYYMVVFCFGLVSGVIVGHFLTGFIK